MLCVLEKKESVGVVLDGIAGSNTVSILEDHRRQKHGFHFNIAKHGFHFNIAILSQCRVSVELKSTTREHQ